MKRILSIITALTLAAAAVPAVLPAAAEIITADEVKEMIYSTGLGAYPEALSVPAKEMFAEEDVLNPETHNISDIFDIASTYRDYQFIDSENPFGEDPQATIVFCAYDARDIFSYIYYFPEQYILENERNTVEYEFTITEEDYNEGVRHSDVMWEDYGEIADIINESGVKNITEIKVISGGIIGVCVYVKGGDEYAIPCRTKTTSDGEKIEKGVIVPFADWCAVADKLNEELYDNSIDINGSAFPEYVDVRDTDTRAAYIGTESVFTDVSGDLASYVNELADLGVITGYGDATFRPENTITRGEAAAMIARMFRYEGSYGGEFIDVSKGDWYANDIAALAANGIINGRSDTEFAPYADIKYQEVMKILVYALGYGSYFYGHGDDAYPFMTTKKAAELGLAEGLSSFDTAAPITRGDMAIMLSNALDTHLWTSLSVIFDDGTGAGTAREDITLIDYLNGKTLNGKLAN